MMEWFAAGGSGMFLILAIGAGSILYGVRALPRPSPERIARLRALPALLAATALFTFGRNMWGVNKALDGDVFQKAHNLTPADMPVVGLVGFTEAVQVFTLAGALAVAVVVLRVVAEGRHAPA